MTKFIKFLKMELNSGATSRTYFGTSAAGAIVYAKKEKSFLILQRQRGIVDGWKSVKEPGTWSITVSGKVDDSDESPLETVKREFKEELRFSGSFKISNKPFDIFKDDNFIFTTFIITVDEIFDPKLNWEHSDYKWITTLKEIPKPIHFGTKRLLQKIKDKYHL